MLEITILLSFAYLCGSLSGALIISTAMNLPNPTNHGSKNPGATNMLRVNGKLAGFFVLIFDVLKGYIPVYIAFRLGVTPLLLGAVAIMACVGHIFPFFFNFNGGKGVATAFGSLLIIDNNFAFLFVITWLLTVLITGYSSLAAIICFVLSPIFVFFINAEFVLPTSMLSILILIKHSSNIRRLIDGQEYKFTRK